MMAESLNVCFGKRICDGKPHIADLTKGPHWVVGGCSGSGKSNFLHSIIAPLVGRMSPRRMKVFLGDPKLVELSIYEDAPHTTIATSVESHYTMLKELEEEMERRYTWMKQRGIRNVVNNSFIGNILVVLDEFGDIAQHPKFGKRITQSVIRLCQLGRACGITLILSTVYPLASIVNSSIRANCSSVCFKVFSATNSRVILGRSGGEKLSECGRMLMLSPHDNDLLEIQTGHFKDVLIDYQIYLSKSRYSNLAVQA